MISQVTGQLRFVQEDRVHVACGDLVLEILIPAADVPGLKADIGGQITLHTIFDLEGDATRGGLTPRLIGFLRLDDKRFFQRFITVKGIGPKRALRALAQPVGNIAAAIESKDAKFLVGLPEIGKRMSEQIIAELSGKLTEFAIAGAVRRPAIVARAAEEEEAIAAAVALGVLRPDAERLLDRARQANPNHRRPQELLREMLRLRTVSP